MAKQNVVTEDELFENSPAEMEYPPIHSMVRSISKTGWTADDGSFQNVMEVDAEVGAWMKAGYKLFNTHFLSENTEAFIVMFILVQQ